MSSEDQTDPDAQAQVSKTSPLSSIWLIPLVALLLGIWMIYYQWSHQGPEITIEFESAAGLEADKSRIKARNVEVGQVTQIRLKRDNAGVIVTARIDQEAEHLLREDTDFWVVSPRVSLQQVSGLNTLLSGPFIELSPGAAEQRRYEFEGLSGPPITPANTPGLFITLTSAEDFSYEAGDSILYKGLTVGKIENVDFDIDEQTVNYNAFVEAPYHRLITPSTRFWDISGIGFELGAAGLSVEAGNMETLLTNGVTFGIPEGVHRGEPIEERIRFTIYPSRQAASDARYRQAAKYTLLIPGTVRGLNPGAPVEYRGLTVGEVLEVNKESYQTAHIVDDDYEIPVIISIQPGRIGMADNEQGLSRLKAQSQSWIVSGLRASLKTGNLFTGGQFVDLSFEGEALTGPVRQHMGYPVIPTHTTGMAHMGDQLASIVAQVDRMPLEAMGRDAQTLLHDLSAMARSFERAGMGVAEITEGLEAQALFSQLSDSLKSLNQLLRAYGQDSDNHDAINRVLKNLNRLMEDLRPLLLQLNQQPNSLIFSDGLPDEHQPKARESR